MKIRNGFVSNSSSSSFVIVGVDLEQTSENCKSICENHLKNVDLENFTEKTCCGKELKSKFCSECGKKSEDIEGTVNWIRAFNYYKYDLQEIEIHSDEDGIILGKRLGLDLEYDSVDIDELIKTLKDAKKTVEYLNLSGKKKLHCGTSYN